MATTTFLVQHDGDTTYTGGAGGTGTGAGALRYRDGHTAGVQAALVEEATTNLLPNPSFESTAAWAAASGAVMTRVTDGTADTGATYARFTKPAADDSAYIRVEDPDPLPNGAVNGESYTMSARARSEAGNTAPCMVGITTSGVGDVYYGDAIIPPDDAWVDLPPLTITMPSSGTMTSNFARVRLSSVTATDGAVHTDSVQVEAKDHATTFCPEFEADGVTLKPGYAWTGTANDSPSTRAAASIAYPIAAPDWIAVRVSADDGDTWSVVYLTSADLSAGPNVATYGSITHDGTNLTIASDRRTLFGPMMAGSGSLTAEDKSTLESTTTWALDTIAPPEPTTGVYIVATGVTGTDENAPVVTIGGSA